MTLPARKSTKEGAKKKESISAPKREESAQPVKKRQAVPMQSALGNRAIEQIYKARKKEDERKRKERKSAEKITPLKREKKTAEPAKVGLKLPASKAAAAEKTEKPKKLALIGDSVKMIETFADASASQIASSLPLLGKLLPKKLEKERVETIKKAPKLVAELKGEAGGRKKKLVKVSATAKKVLEGTEAETEEAKEKLPEHRDFSPPVKNEKILGKLAERSFKDFVGWFKSHFRSFLNSIHTTDPGLNTKAGVKPKVRLEGRSDPARSDKDEAEAKSVLFTERDKESEKFLKNPGQERIRPKRVEKEFKAEPSPKKVEPVKSEESEGMRDYLQMPIPKSVRDKADELLKPVLEGGLKKLVKEAKNSEKKRDEEKKREEEKKKREARELNSRAQKEQEDVVMEGRRNVAGEQQRGIEEAHKAADEFSKDSAKERKKTKKSVKDSAKKAEEDAGKEIKKGEKEAEDLKKKGEQDAAKKKRELKEKQRDKSWWDRAVDAIKSVVKAITKAIDKIFTAVRKAVKKAIDKAKKLAIGLINKARKFILKKLEAFRKWAKKMVNRYLKKYFPALAKRINKAIDRFVDKAKKVVNKVADGLIAGVKALADALSKVLDKILSVFQTALKAAVQIAGAVLTGDFAEALKIAIQAACDIAGIDSKPIFGFLRRAGALFLKILKNPGRFFKNLANAVGGGVRNFAKNIKKHLINGLFAWLTGVLSEAQIELPKRFDAKGIFSLAMQILGLTYANIKARIIRRYPPAQGVIEKLEKGFEIIKELVTKGPSALWKMVADSLRNFKEMVISGIRNFVITTLVKEGILWLLSLLNPVSAIVKVIKLLYDFIMFLVESYEQIKSFVVSVYNSIAAIAAGALGPAKKAVEASLARILPVAINLLARLAGLGGIAKTVRKIIAKVSRPVNKVIDKIIDKAVAFAKKLLGKGKRGFKKVRKKAKKIVYAIKKRIGRPIAFLAGKERHRLWIERKKGRAVPMAASRPQPVVVKLKRWKREIGKLPQPHQKRAEKLIEEALGYLKNLDTKANTEVHIQEQALKDKKVTQSEAKKARDAESKTVQSEKDLVKVLKELLPLFESEAGELEKRFEAELAKMHPAAHTLLLTQLRKLKTKRIRNWETLQKRLKSSKSFSTLLDKPLSSRHMYGRSVQKHEAHEALESAKKKKPQQWQKYINKNPDKNEKEFISARVGVIHGKNTKNIIKAFENLKNYIFDVSKRDSVVGSLREYYEAALEKSSSKTHTDYEPKIDKNAIKLENNIFSIEYSYTSEQHKEKKFRVEFDFSKIDVQAETTQTVHGEKLMIKESGSRGKTVPSGELKDFEKYGGKEISNKDKFLKLEFLRSFVKKRLEEKNAGENKLKRAAETSSMKKLLEMLDKEEQDKFDAEFNSFKAGMKRLGDKQRFDSAHLLADWFGGSGYEKALNLVVTSAEYNRVVMADAETKIADEVKKVSPVTVFDLTVAATWDQLSDTEVKNAVNAPSINKQIKSKLHLEPDESKNMAEEAAKELYSILSSKQDPRRVLRVRYYGGKITHPVEKQLTERAIGCDIWMSSFFKFDKKEKCYL